jgi:hypothetical protein
MNKKTFNSLTVSIYFVRVLFLLFKGSLKFGLSVFAGANR